ncbi:MAG: hypothetical protein KGN77_02090 [Xanthomonadaceae bacterium]|nr:hypothetical protein [Xanthomonadaceae bacterium]
MTQVAMAGNDVMSGESLVCNLFDDMDAFDNLPAAIRRALHNAVVKIAPEDCA